ncbi:hypothetical protein LRS13_00695 [Svornostia abyssi]|uniref:Uncharacterized protein n=1 Tax=Svornostia abyssi TaxID=2898438 RepID=A0ABY5PHC1_9ACTN|nr:hypothetical protein LRS13_00695 [Parviterribacteraceae bacterium J379]
MITQTPTDLYERLELLRIERALAMGCELRYDPAYMADLDTEIAAMHAAWVGAAVTEIAVLRAALVGAPQG